MPIITDPRDTESAIVGGVRTDLFAPTPTEGPAPGALDVLAAASRQATLAGAGYERFANSDPDVPDAPPGYDPLDHIQGFEDDAHAFVDAVTPSDVEGIKQRIIAGRADRATLGRAGLGGPGAQLAMNILDPSFLVASLAVPEIALAKSVRVGRVIKAAVEGAAGATTYEVGMHQLQDDRTIGESLLNVGAGTLLAGALGSLGRRIPTERTDALRAAIEAEVRSESGAASAAPRTTLQQETLARGGQTLSKVAGAIPLTKTDGQVVMASESHAARTVLQELADVSPLLTKHTEGIASPVSVESLVGRHEGRIADFVEEMNRQYATYRARVDSSGRLSKEDFYAAVSSAARHGDRDRVPEIGAASKYLRERVFDPLKVEAQRLGLLPKEVSALGAESYFRRMYDRNAIRKNRAEWDNILVSHFMTPDVGISEATAAAEDVTRKILGADVGQANFNFRVDVPTAGPLMERVLDIPDMVIEKFLVNDPVKVANAYVRELAPQIEITERFGDKDMAGAFDRVRDEYDVMRQRARSVVGVDASATLTRLTENERTTLEALTRIRDRIYGRAGRLGPEASDGRRTAVNVARGWRNLVASAKLGVAALTSAPTDTANIVAEFGFLPTMAKLAKLVTSPAYRNLSRDQARHLGAAVEVAMGRRVNVAFDGAVTEGWTQKLANGVYKYTGLNHWTDFGRTLSATLFEDRVLKAAQGLADGHPLGPFTRTRLAAAGLDDNALLNINRQAREYGGDVDGVRVSGSGNWLDAELAEKYDAAVLKESRRLVMQPGAADRPWWADSETGRVIGQLKSFSLAAIPRITTRGAQAIGQGQYGIGARFIGSMLIGGYLAHTFRQLTAGKSPTTDPSAAASEAFTEAGLGGVLPDLLSPIGRRVGLFGESARYSDRNVLSALGGPALGTLEDAVDFAFNRTANGMNARDLQLLRRLLPYQNVWWLRRAINALEGETAEALDLAGADTKTFGQRFIETTPLLPSKQRGATGTGQLVQ